MTLRSKQHPIQSTQPSSQSISSFPAETLPVPASFPQDLFAGPAAGHHGHGHCHPRQLRLRLRRRRRAGGRSRHGPSGAHEATVYGARVPEEEITRRSQKQYGVLARRKGKRRLLKKGISHVATFHCTSTLRCRPMEAPESDKK